MIVSRALLLYGRHTLNIIYNFFVQCLASNSAMYAMPNFNFHAKLTPREIILIFKKTDDESQAFKTIESRRGQPRCFFL